MKVLIAYYSRTGMNETVANELHSKLEGKKTRCDIEEIVDRADRRGFWGYVRSGFQAATMSKTEIARPRKDPSQYDVVILLSPIWAGRITPALRTYASRNSKKFRHIAFVSVSGSGTEGNSRGLRDVEDIVGKKPLAWMMIADTEMKDGLHRIRLDQFIRKLQGK